MRLFRFTPFIAFTVGTLFLTSYEVSPTPPTFTLAQARFKTSPIGLIQFLAPSLKTVREAFPQRVTIADLLDESQDYHQQVVTVQGLITQPELHLDETELYLDFVFRLTQKTHAIIVYGRHDRTLGPPAIEMNQSVEVIGTFFKEQERAGSVLVNVLEAISVVPYPSSIPRST